MLDSRVPKPHPQNTGFGTLNTLFFSSGGHNLVPFWTAVVYDRPRFPFPSQNLQKMYHFPAIPFEASSISC